MYYFRYLVSIVCTLVSFNLIAANCSSNNIYNAYQSDFSCNYVDSKLSLSSVDTINFHYTSANTVCTIISKKPETIYLNHYINCDGNAAHPVSRKINLVTGTNTIRFKSSCFKDNNNNQANLFFDKQDKNRTATMMISCSSRDDNKATGAKDGTGSNNNNPFPDLL